MHSGVVMEWIDEAATLVAERWNQGSAVAVYAGGVRFHQPLHVRDLVEVQAWLIHTGASALGQPAHGRTEPHNRVHDGACRP